MQCAHCSKVFEKKDQFEVHHNDHRNTQKLLRRPAGRTYGARYMPKDKSVHRGQWPSLPTAQSEAVPLVLPNHETAGLAQDKEHVNKSTSTNRDKDEAGDIDGRIRDILERFPPLEGHDGDLRVADAVEVKCRDCDLKFWSKQEREGHYLSQYCRGSHIVAYCFFVDSSQRCGYRVERKTIPLDGYLHKSLFQCRKCDSLFPSEREKEGHEITHLLSPSRCLHCQKMFSTEYELEDHYDWHDDMQYRSERAEVKENPIAQSQEPEEVSGEAIDLGHGIQKLPVPWITGSTRLKPRKDGELCGISFISSEDVEKYMAPRGEIKDPTHYIRVPTGPTETDYDYISEVLRKHDEERKLSLVPGPPHEATSEKDQDASDVRSNRTAEPKFPIHFSPPVPRPLNIMCHHSSGLMQVTDVSRRTRWVEPDAFVSLLGQICWLVTDDDRQHIDTAVKLEESEKFQQATDYWIRVLDSLTSRHGSAVADRKFPIMDHIAALATEAGLFDRAVDFKCQALDLCEKIYGKDDRDNFGLINDLAVLFEGSGRLQEAASLYRRSLSGRLVVLGPNHADTLMTMQKLGEINLTLGNPGVARLLLEKAYIGFENLPDEQMGLSTLNILSAAYDKLGFEELACTLQRPTATPMREKRRLGNSLTTYSLCNPLLSTTDPFEVPLFMVSCSLAS